jgi:hypothetical protein
MTNPVTDSEFMEAVVWMGKVIPMFPADATAKSIIAKALASFVYSSDGLAWLTSKAIEEFKDWGAAGGIPALRDLYGSYLRQLEWDEEESKLIAWKAEKRKEITAPVERQQVVPIREPQIKPESQPWPAFLHADPDYKNLEEPDPDHPGQWRLKQTGPIRTPEEFARELQQLEADLEKLQKRG